ncbi:hypothetical protein M527_26245 [Sphingobium indicum IP26]|nr:hypothetical protein M527_26245 [Sphingobium indicum IP26]EQB09337.1 hypothetical protein L286_00790 [Sphingobium sp. HDIP04]
MGRGQDGCVPIAAATDAFDRENEPYRKNPAKGDLRGPGPALRTSKCREAR